MPDWQADLDAREAFWENVDFWNRVPRGAIYAPDPIHPWRRKIIFSCATAATCGAVIGLFWAVLLAGGVE